VKNLQCPSEDLKFLPNLFLTKNATVHNTVVTNNKLEIWGKAQRESANCCKSD